MRLWDKRCLSNSSQRHEVPGASPLRPLSIESRARGITLTSRHSILRSSVRETTLLNRGVTVAARKCRQAATVPASGRLNAAPWPTGWKSLR
jgi:hypothetical protein